MSCAKAVIQICAVVCGVLWAAQARAGESPNVEALRQQYQELTQKYNTVQSQYYQSREMIARQDDLAELGQRLAEARDARDKKIAGSPQVQAAQKASADSYAALNKTVEAEIAADPQGASLQKQMATLDDQIDDLESQQRLTNFLLNEVQRKVARKPEIRALYQAISAADSAIYEAQRKDPKVAAAYKAYNEAQQLVLARPEIDAARKAYDDAIKTSPLVAEATKTREAAKTAYDQAIAAAVAAHPDTAGLKKKQEDLAEKLRTLNQNKQSLTTQLQRVRQRINNANPKIVAARKAYYAADAAYRQTIAAAAPNESVACQELEQRYSQIYEARAAADPTTSALKRENDELAKQVQEMQLKLRRAEGSPPRRRPRG